MLGAARLVGGVGVFLTQGRQCLLLEWVLPLPWGARLTLPVYADSISCLFAASVALIAAAVLSFSSAYIASEKYSARFHALVLAFVASMLLLIFRPNLISLLLG